MPRAAILGSGRVGDGGGQAHLLSLSISSDHRPHHAVGVFCYFHLTTGNAKVLGHLQVALAILSRKEPVLP